MKNLSIKGMIVLMVTLASVATAYATPPTTVSGDWYVSDVAWGPNGEFMPTVTFTGPFDGAFTHSFTQARADHVEFKGCVQGVYGTLELTALAFNSSGETTTTINHGSGDLQNLRGQGVARITGFDPYGLPLGEYEMNIHFDPSYPGPSPECD